MYTATERLYITKDGKVMREHEMDQDTVAFLLVGEGGQLTDARAKELGLTIKAKAKADAEEVKPEPEVAPEGEPEAEVKAEEPAADKAVKAAPANKAKA